MNRVRQIISELLATLNRLSARERRLLALTASVVLVGVATIASLGISRILAQREGRIRSKSEQMNEVNKLTGGFKAAEAQRNELERKLRGNQLKLFTYLDELSKKQGLQIGGMTDKGTQPLAEGAKITESSVELNLTHVPLNKLVRFLNEVELTQGLVKVTHVQVRPRTDETVLDAWVTVTTYALARIDNEPGKN